ncbi:MAG: hypothetical protein KJ070_00330 [Verrucomicrobia bacterium]|nr:hypothetical protein [Verrucomicrobiota bacterium]
MTIEVFSEANGRSYKMSPKAFGKLLHLARLEGWQPERLPAEWPSDSWETEIILPHLGPYMPGRVSRADAEGLRIALTRALATGVVAVEGTVQYAAVTLLQVARAGAFRVRVCHSENAGPVPILGAATA